MTFVRACRVGERVVIHSDWLVTDPARSRPPGFTDGILKSLLLSRTLCVSYAGRIEDCLVAIRDARRKYDGLPSRASLLADLCVASERADCEFIVAFLDPIEIFEVTGGRLSQVHTAWIGNQRALEVFQSEMHLVQERGEVGALGASGRAFDAVVRSGLDDVGVLAVSVITTDEGFEYAPALQLAAGFTPQVIPPHTSTAITWGSESDGGFAMMVLAPSTPTPALAVYFPHGHFGLVSDPLNEQSTVTVAGETQRDFIDGVRERIGLEFSRGFELG